MDVLFPPVVSVPVPSRTSPARSWGWSRATPDMSCVHNGAVRTSMSIPVSTWNDLKEYAEFTQEFVAYAESSMKAGKTVEQAAADYKMAPTHKGYIVSINPAFVGPKSNLQIAYDELKKK